MKHSTGFWFVGYHCIIRVNWILEDFRIFWKPNTLSGRSSKQENPPKESHYNELLMSKAKQKLAPIKQLRKLKGYPSICSHWAYRKTFRNTWTKYTIFDCWISNAKTPVNIRTNTEPMNLPLNKANEMKWWKLIL